MILRTTSTFLPTNIVQLSQFGKLPVIGGRNCQSVTQSPAHGEEFKIGERISVKALHTPCHTQDSICYFMQDGDQRVVFTGDTLFIGGMYRISFRLICIIRLILLGCGRFFEGNAEEMHKALNETLAALPDDTKVYVCFTPYSWKSFANGNQPGHEYTKANVKFCAHVSQSEPIMKLQAFAEANQQTQGKFTIGDEKVRIIVTSVYSSTLLTEEIAPQCVHARQRKPASLCPEIYTHSAYIF